MKTGKVFERAFNGLNPWDTQEDIPFAKAGDMNSLTGSGLSSESVVVHPHHPQCNPSLGRPKKKGKTSKHCKNEDDNGEIRTHA